MSYLNSESVTSEGQQEERGDAQPQTDGAEVIVMTSLIKKNILLNPTKQLQPLTTNVAPLGAIIEVHGGGERALELKLFAPTPCGVLEAEVTFEIDANGISIKSINEDLKDILSEEDREIVDVRCKEIMVGLDAKQLSEAEKQEVKEIQEFEMIGEFIVTKLYGAVGAFHGEFTDVANPSAVDASRPGPGPTSEKVD